MIADFILIADALLKLMWGVALVLSSGRLIATLGLPSGEPRFYMRLLGSVLIGVGLALMVEAMPTGWRGLGAGGGAAVNLAAAAMLVLLLIGRSGRPSAAGRRLLWIFAASMLAMGVLESIIA